MKRGKKTIFVCRLENGIRENEKKRIEELNTLYTYSQQSQYGQIYPSYLQDKLQHFAKIHKKLERKKDKKKFSTTCF